MNLTVDASVFVSASRRTELHHLDSDRILMVINQRSESLWCPNLVIVETVAALARTSTDPTGSVEVRARIAAFPQLHLVPLDTERSELAADLAASQRLRGADAVYLAVA